MYNCVIFTKKEVFSAQTFFYNKERHYLNYLVDTEWQTISNVKCEITYNHSLILIYTEPLEVKNGFGETHETEGYYVEII